MLVYSGTKESFITDALNGTIANSLDELFFQFGIKKESRSEFNSWKNSLQRMALVMSDKRIDNDVQIAIEYQIPLTSKRVDFMAGGNDGVNDNVVIVELKQWESCESTDKVNVVKTYLNNSICEVVHPSQQVYSYAKLIENFNETIRIENIHLYPCAFLHNYDEKYKNEILNAKYQEAIDDAPVFLAKDGEKLQEYIVKYVSKASNKKLFDIIDNGKLKPSKSLQDCIRSILNGSNEFELIDEQLVAYSNILKIIENAKDSNEKHTIIVKGGPGTGKSVIAINLLAKLINNGLTCFYATKNSAPRTAFCSKLIGKNNHSNDFLKGLFKSSGSFVYTPNNAFDCILCDEAHRLNAKSGMYSNLGENQIKEIIKSSKISVFFIDEDQIISTKDIGTIKEITNRAKEQNSIVHVGKSLELKSQFRCNGSDGYLAFLDNLLEIRETANYSFDSSDYDFRLFDDPNLMRAELEKTNIHNKSRMIAGYCYPWNSKNDKSKYDIFLENGFKAQWNFTTDKFALDENSFNQVGCIHSTQGLEFEYVGVIIGRDLRFENGKVITDRTQRAKSDATIKGLNGNEALGDKIIRNTYKTLLSRGQKGCFVYCEDKNLSNYIKKMLALSNRLNKIQQI